jgi:GT2 family glycosyltransferase
MTTDTTLVIIVKNEINSCKKVVPKIDRNLFDYIYAVDGNSTDGTREYLQKNNIDVFTQNIPKKKTFDLTFGQKNIANAIKIGIRKSKTKYIVYFFTPDGNMLPEKLEELIKTAKSGYDFVTVSRYKKPAISYDDSIISKFGNHLFTKLVNIFFRGNYTDVLGAYKIINKKIIDEKFLDNCNITINTQISIRCLKKKFPYKDIPGDEPKREFGASSRSVIINGLMELYTILSAFIIKDKFK